MAIGLVHEIPGADQEVYDSIVRELNGGPMRSLSDWPAEGILVHVAGPYEGGWRVVDVWESEEALQAFGAELQAAIQRAGVDVPEPTTFPVYNFVKE
jgi:hypothetical protein